MLGIRYHGPERRDRRKATEVGDQEYAAERGNTISLSPRTLILIVIAALSIAGGGSTILSGFFHSGQATAISQDSSAVQIAVLQTRLSNIESKVDKLDEKVSRLLLHESEDHDRRGRQP